MPTKTRPQEPALELAQAPDISVEIVTPEKAQEYLYRNKNNRAVSVETVTAYARDIRAGNWRQVGDPIRFDTDGNLLDGQHRLHAVIAAEVPVPFFVIRGLSVADSQVMDVGRKRTGANALEMAGFGKNVMSMSAAAVIGIADDAGKLISNNSRTRQPTHAELIGWAQENFPHMTDSHRLGMKSYAQHRGSAAGYVYGAYRLYKASPTRSLEFLSDVAEMVGEGKGDPRSALNRRLSVLGITARMKSKGVRTVHCFTEAFNAWSKGEELHTIHDPDRGTPLRPVIEGP